MVSKVHLNSIFELEHQYFVTENFTPFDFSIHDVVKAGGWPFPLRPGRHQYAVAKEAYWGLDREAHSAELELEIELPNPQLGSGFTEYRCQIKLFRKSVHILQFNVGGSWHAAPVANRQPAGAFLSGPNG